MHELQWTATSKLLGTRKKKETTITERRAATPDTTRTGFNYEVATKTNEEVSGRTNGNDIIIMFEEIKTMFETFMGVATGLNSTGV